MIRSPDASQKVTRAAEQLLGEAKMLADEINCGIGPLGLLASLTVSLAAEHGQLDVLIAHIERVRSGAARPAGVIHIR